MRSPLQPLPDLLLPSALFLVGCVTAAPVSVDSADATEPSGRSAVGDLAAGATTRIEAFFGSAFGESYAVRVLPTRAAFDASFPPEWGVGKTQCWMVAFGVADRLHVLDPAVWKTEACEHDGDDVEHVRGIVAHELVHVFHGQNNPTRDFTGMDAMGWFPEGLAVLVSGQLAGHHAGAAREAIAAGVAPKCLEDAWSGEYRYGVSGSLVAYVDATFGRTTLVALLAATTEEELLERLGVGEEELLAGMARVGPRGRRSLATPASSVPAASGLHPGRTEGAVWDDREPRRWRTQAPLAAAHSIASTSPPSRQLLMFFPAWSHHCEITVFASAILLSPEPSKAPGFVRRTVAKIC